MAFTDLGSLGAVGSTNNNQTTLDLVTTAAVVAGELVVVVVAADNIANGGDDNACSGVTLGVGGQALTKGLQVANALAAQAGASASIWYGLATSGLASGGTIRATFGSASLVDASGLTARHFSVAASNTVAIEGTPTTLLHNTALDPGALDVTTANIACLRVRGIASQVGNNTNLTPTASWTAWANGNSATTGTIAEMCARAEHRIVTGTTGSSNPTYVSAINANVYVAFKEVAPTINSGAGDADGVGAAAAQGEAGSALRPADGDADGIGAATGEGRSVIGAQTGGSSGTITIDSASGTGNVAVGTNGGQKAAQNFISVGTAISTIRVWLRKVGSPTDGVQLRLFTVDASHHPTTTQIGVTSNVVAAASFNFVADPFDFEFSPASSVSNGGEYAFVVERTGAIDETNFYQLQFKETTYASANLQYYDGSWGDLAAYDARAFISQEVPSGGVGAATAQGAQVRETTAAASGIGAAAASGVDGAGAALFYLRPDGDSAADGWTDQADGTTNIYQTIDEASASDSDYVQSPEVVAGSATLKVRLFDGATQIVEWTHSDVGETFSNAEQTLTTPQYEAISNFANLVAELDDNASNVYRFSLGNPSGGADPPVKVRYRYKKSVTVETENLLTQPSAFDHADWTKADVTVSANVVTDPDSGSAADRLNEVAVTGIHAVHRSLAKATSSLTYNFSVYAKILPSNIRTRIRLQVDDAVANGVFAGYDLATPQIGNATAAFGSTFSGGTPAIPPAGGGWYRCELNGITTGSEATLRILILIDQGTTTGPTDVSFAGNVNAGIYLYNAVLVEA